MLIAPVAPPAYRAAAPSLMNSIRSMAGTGSDCRTKAEFKPDMRRPSIMKTEKLSWGLYRPKLL